MTASHRNLQAPAGSINNGHRPIAPLRPADNLKSNAVERVEGIKDLNVRALRAQGIVGGGVTTRISTVSFLPEDSRTTANAGVHLRKSASFSR